MKIKYTGSVGTRSLKFFQNILLRRVLFTDYIVSNCSWKKIDDGKRYVIKIGFERSPSYRLFPQYKKVNIYKRMGVLDLVWLGWIYIRRERDIHYELHNGKPNEDPWE